MNKQRWLSSFFGALISHGIGAVILLLLTAIGLRLDDPSSAVYPTVFSSLFAGAILAGILFRRQGNAGVSVLGAFFYAVIPLAVSFFGKNEFFTLGVRLLVFSGLMAITVAVALLFPQTKRRKKRKSRYHRPY